MVVVRTYVLRARRDGIRIKLAKASVSSAQEGEQHLPRLQDLAALPAKPVNTPTQEVALIAKLGSIKIKTDRTHVLLAQLATTVHLAPIIPRLVQLEPLALLPDSKRQRVPRLVRSDSIALLDQLVVQRALLVSTVV
jgi:hypothetical protein